MPEDFRDCGDCGASPGTPHKYGCDVERCSVCGGQRIQCSCKDHDRMFARWTGFWPGKAEAELLGLTLNEMDGQIGAVVYCKPNAHTIGFPAENMNLVLLAQARRQAEKTKKHMEAIEKEEGKKI